ncbi:ELF3-like protein 2 [Neltuma alba]|uniref:ELF3-like protein 2 n=1 Tax=Neltuma alba TaxID=207710 RepID=UPI0010A334ED|nr:ELF3-like protein 2 [Prosopis alba]
MKGGIEEVKEISPMFPRLHVKDADKGGPKAPPRNKMALYEQFAIPSQSLAPGSPPKFPPLLAKNFPVPSLSGKVGSSQGIQFCNSGVSCYLAEKIHTYQSRAVNFKLMPDGPISCNSSVKNYEHGDALVTPVSARGKNSCCSISQNEEDEDKLPHCKSSCSLISQNSFSKKVNLTRPIKLVSARYENQIDDHTEVSQTDLPEDGSAQPLAGFGDMTDESSISSVKIRTPKQLKKAHSSFMEDFRSISADGLKILQGSNGLTNEEVEAYGDKINLRDGYLEKPATTDVHKCPDVLELGRNFFWGKIDGHKNEDTYRHYDAMSKSIPDYAVGLKITPDDVMGVIGEKQFWRARATIINQQKVFVHQVFELHRLIKVQKLIAGSPSLLIQDKLLLSKPSLEESAPKKLQSDYIIEQPSSNAKLNNTKLEKPTPAECAENILLPLPGINSMSKAPPSVQLPNYGHHSGNNQLALPAPTNNTKPSQCYIYPAPGNQWLVPFMSPSEGLVYKPIVGQCPPNTGLMGPVYSACNPISLTPGNKDVQDATHVPYVFPPCGPAVMHPSSVSAFAHEQISPPPKMQSKGTTENYQSTGVVNSAILYQSSSNMSSQISQVMSRHVTNDNHTSEDKDLQTSIGSSPPKRMKGDALPLFPMAPTFWASSDQQKAQAVEGNQPRIIKAIPHNPKSTIESAARIFRSIQEERKYL